MERPSRERIDVNYFFFGALLALLIITSTCSVIVKKNLISSRFFFWMYSFGQSLFEVLFFVFISSLIRRFLGRIAFWCFIGLVFLSFLLHLADFMMDRILDLSVWETISFLFDETFENFINLLEASGIPLWTWALFFTVTALLPLFGMLIYRGTDWLTKKKPLALRRTTFLQFFFCIPAALFFWDYSASRVIQPDDYTAFVKSLPWKHTFLEPKNIHLSAPAPLHSPKSEEEVLQALETIDWKLKKKPNIFLFVVESLREDCITPQGAPHLSAFRNQNIRAATAVSNANSTAISWFSIFHSQFPLHWHRLQSDGWKLGSPALALFKKLGYRIHLYSAAGLSYYGMETLLFGENHSLLDTYRQFPHIAPKEAFQSDGEAVASLQEDLARDSSLREGNFFIVFLDSTHFNYSWPKDYPAQFTPYAKEFDYFKAYQSSKNIDLIKNRYRNSIHYMDSLFGEFLASASPDSLIVFTGDHGEEFFDNGHLFHNSHLSAAQTTIPLYLRIPSSNQELPFLSQMDIMPTLLDAVAHETTPILQGESALRPKTWPFAIIARFNAGRAPYEFCIHNGKTKLTLQFQHHKQLYTNNRLRILSRRSCRDKSLPACTAEIHEWIHSEFDPALSRLFE